jgi:hypothetical protein
LLAVPFFQPWYVIWPLALVALLDWRPAGVLAVAFSASAESIYLIWRVRSLFVFVPVIALLLYLLWRAWRSKSRAIPPALPDAQIS